MLDLRYLGLSLIGVFMALAVGLMLGTALAGPDRRDEAYQHLRAEFDLLRQDVQRVRDQSELTRRRLDAADRALQKYAPTLVEGRLAGQSVAVILSGGVNEGSFWDELERALRAGGASIDFVIRLPEELRPAPPDLAARAPVAWKLEHPPARRASAAAWAVRALGRSGYGGLAQDLLTRAGGEFRGDTSKQPDSFLLITSADDDLRAARITAEDSAERAIIKAAELAGKRLVLAEPEDARPGVVAALQGAKLSSVDNIDTAAGQISVVLALAGAGGRFGSKSSADEPIAPPDGAHTFNQVFPR